MRATRLSVANYNTTLSSDSLETGTGSSNSLRSTIQSPSSRTSQFRFLGELSPAGKIAQARFCRAPRLAASRCLRAPSAERARFHIHRYSARMPPIFLERRIRTDMDGPSFFRL
jgi:hypothetical protein